MGSTDVPGSAVEFVEDLADNYAEDGVEASLLPEHNSVAIFAPDDDHVREMIGIRAHDHGLDEIEVVEDVPHLADDQVGLRYGWSA